MCIYLSAIKHEKNQAQASMSISLRSTQKKKTYGNVFSVFQCVDVKATYLARDNIAL